MIKNLRIDWCKNFWKLRVLAFLPSPKMDGGAKMVSPVLSKFRQYDKCGLNRGSKFASKEKFATQLRGFSVVKTSTNRQIFIFPPYQISTSASWPNFDSVPFSTNVKIFRLRQNARLRWFIVLTGLESGSLPERCLVCWVEMPCPCVCGVESDL